ncbi:MAG: 23S rRNA (uracil(1939)-C(5))-methyltransferase RlmD [Clostridiales bacterium]|nr:23S rRNA (uracil(1939)-C(5))-methyltransferase RlmD [Clostridiales bacterium]
MNVKDIIEVEILSNGMDGEGVARVDNKVVFVPYTLKSERVRAVVKSVKSRYATASVIKVLSSSDSRVEPICPHYFKCGGCDMMHVNSDYRREVLIDELKNNFAKIAGMDLSDVEFVPSSFNRRNKIAMPFGIVDGRTVVGMYRQNSHTVEPVHCLMAGELTQNIIRTVVDFANAEKLSVYDGKSGQGLLRHLVVREIDGRASVTLVVNGESLGERLENKLSNLLPVEVDLFVCPNTRNNNVIMGDTVRLVKGNAHLDVDVCGVRAELSPLSFFQVNDEIRDKLYTEAISCVSSNTLIDLYSGIGILSNLAAKKCDMVYAVEIVPQATADADKTAILNGNAQKIQNICGNVEKVLPKLKSELSALGEADIIVDPPRKGCGAAVINAIAEVAPKTLVYISCNHATMCRDVRLFLDESTSRGNSYIIEKVKLFDMFENTHHVETLTLLSRK